MVINKRGGKEKESNNKLCILSSITELEVFAQKMQSILKSGQEISPIALLTDRRKDKVNDRVAPILKRQDTVHYILITRKVYKISLAQQIFIEQLEKIFFLN